MVWTLTSSVDEFLAATHGLLAADPAGNTVLLTVSDRVREAGPNAFGGGAASFGWWLESDDAPVSGAFLSTPPYPVRLSVMSTTAAAELATELGRAAASVAGVPSVVDPFVQAWTAATGGSAAVQMNQRQYRLGILAMPDVAGSPRKATTADRDLLVAWYHEFFNEPGGSHGDPRSAVDSRLESGAMWLWDDLGAPVSVAGSSPVLAGMARIGPVYTPPELRGRGYASAVTAAASADALARGADEVLLYTDLANPTSNSIYQKIGYRPTADEIIVNLVRRPEKNRRANT